MSKVCIININYSVHNISKDGVDPSAIKLGKGIKMIKSYSEEECMKLLKDLFEKNGILALENK